MTDLRIFTADDEAWTVGFWDGCEADRVFAPAILDGSDTLAGVIDFAEKMRKHPTIFVLDSRMYLSDSNLARVAADLSRQYGFSLRLEEAAENLNGFLVGCWIRALSDTYRVILLTAFAQEIYGKLQSEVAMRVMYDRAIAGLFPKSDTRAIKKAVRRLVRELELRFVRASTLGDKY
jgi:hypothetical protein